MTYPGSPANTDSVPVGVSLVDRPPEPPDPWRRLLLALLCFPYPGLDQEGSVPLPSFPFMPSITHISLQQHRCVLLHVEGQPICLTDGLSWGSGGPWTEGWQQQGQQAERSWQKKSEVRPKPLTLPTDSFIPHNNSNGYSPCSLQQPCTYKSGQNHPESRFPIQKIPFNSRPMYSTSFLTFSLIY